MNNNLISLSSIPNEDISKLFDENDDLRSAVEHWTSRMECDYYEEIFYKCFRNVHFEYQLGCWTHRYFRVYNNIADAANFIQGCFDMQKDYCILDEHGEADLKKLDDMWNAYSNNQNEDLDDQLEHLVVSGMKVISDYIEQNIEGAFAYWENEEHVKEDQLDSFVECYGDRIFIERGEKPGEVEVLFAGHIRPENFG